MFVKTQSDEVFDEPMFVKMFVKMFTKILNSRATPSTSAPSSLKAKGTTSLLYSKWKKMSRRNFFVFFYVGNRLFQEIRLIRDIPHCIDYNVFIPEFIPAEAVKDDCQKL